ncbi:MAG: histidinol-phosphatase [Clostridia bacterium]|nr:histidinol-phosphatase [Clostridia bacterium]
MGIITHTTFSHGKGTVLENAHAAQEMGLKELGIADHGFGHILYGMDKRDLPKLRAEIENATAQTGVHVLLGVEANFISPKGDIDISPADIEKFDFILVGQHRFVKARFADKFGFLLPNILGIKSKKMREKNTNAIIAAMEKYPIDAITPPKHGMAIDVLAVAKKAVETNTMIELNASKMLFSREEITKMCQMGVMFLISSDAHHPEKIGRVENILKVVKEYNIPESQVANLNKLPTFKRKKL